jgi:hypothetical protein
MDWQTKEHIDSRFDDLEEKIDSIRRHLKIEDEEGEKTIRKVDPNDILMVSDDPVQDETMSDKVI